MRFEDQTFENTEVTFDYNQFVRCTFRNITLFFHGGDWSIVECHFDGQIKIAVGGSANNTLTFMKWLKQAAPDALDGLLKDAGLSTAMPASTRPS